MNLMKVLRKQRCAHVLPDVVWPDSTAHPHRVVLYAPEMFCDIPEIG